jgi:hypothetical protein
MVINPMAVLAVAAGVNGLLAIAGKQSPAWLRVLAAAGVGVAVVSNLRAVIERQEREDIEAVDRVAGDDVVVTSNPFTGAIDDLSYVSGKLLNWY